MYSTSGTNFNVFLSPLFSSRLRHPNIVTFFCACLKAPNCCIVLEYCSRGSLESVLRDPVIPIDHPKRLQFAMDIARGMNYLHSQDPPIIHRDLKSDNVLVRAFPFPSPFLLFHFPFAIPGDPTFSNAGLNPNEGP